MTVFSMKNPTTTERRVTKKFNQLYIWLQADDEVRCESNYQHNIILIIIKLPNDMFVSLQYQFTIHQIVLLKNIIIISSFRSSFYYIVQG